MILDRSISISISTADVGLQRVRRPTKVRGRGGFLRKPGGSACCTTKAAAKQAAFAAEIARRRAGVNRGDEVSAMTEPTVRIRTIHAGPIKGAECPLVDRDSPRW